MAIVADGRGRTNTPQWLTASAGPNRVPYGAVRWMIEERRVNRSHRASGRRTLFGEANLRRWDEGSRLTDGFSTPSGVPLQWFGAYPSIAASYPPTRNLASRFDR